MAKRSKADRKKKKRQERIRQQNHQRRSQPRDDGWDDEDDGPRDFDLERILRARALARGKWLVSQQDLTEALLLTRGEDPIFGPGEEPDAAPEEQAQELAFRAMESRDQDEHEDLVAEALELDPACGDALRLLIQSTCTGDERRARLEELAAALERDLDPAAADEAGPRLACLLPARPFLRVLQVLVGDAAKARDHETLFSAYRRLARHDHIGAWVMLERIFDPVPDWDLLRRLQPLIPVDGSTSLALDGLIALQAGERAQAHAAFRQLSLRDPHLEMALTRPESLEILAVLPERRHRAQVLAHGMASLVRASGFLAWYDQGMPVLDEAERQRALGAYTGPLAALLTLGEAISGWIDQHDLLALGLAPQHRQDLERMVHEPLFRQLAGHDPASFVPIHAWRALGALGDPASLPVLLEVLHDEENDFADEEIPQVVAQLGPAVVVPLLTAHADWYARAGWESRASKLLESLALLATHHPEARPAAIARPAFVLGDRAADHPEARASAVEDLCLMRATDQLPAIERAHIEGRLDELHADQAEVRRRMGAD